VWLSSSPELQQLAAGESTEFDDLPLVDIQRLAPAAGGGALFDSLVVFEDVCTADYGRAFGADVTAVRWFETTNFLAHASRLPSASAAACSMSRTTPTRFTRERGASGSSGTMWRCWTAALRDAAAAGVAASRSSASAPTLRGWNDTRGEVPDLCLHQLLARQSCKSTPTIAVAVVDGVGALDVSASCSRTVVHAWRAALGGAAVGADRLDRRSDVAGAAYVRSTRRGRRSAWRMWRAMRG
jgi:hypothetical protein